MIKHSILIFGEIPTFPSRFVVQTCCHIIYVNRYINLNRQYEIISPLQYSLFVCLDKIKMLAFNISSEFLHFKDNESCGPASSSIQSPINKNLSIYLGSMYVLIPFSLNNIFIKRCIIVTVVGFLGNLLTLLSIPWARHNGLYGFSDHPSKHTSIFVLNLAFADFLYCVTSLPLNAFTVNLHHHER